MAARITKPNQTDCESKRQLNIQTIRQALLRFYSPSECEVWLSNPHELLGGDSALDRIKVGQESDVVALIHVLEAGAYL